MISLPIRGVAQSLRDACNSDLLSKPVNVSTMHRWRLKGLRGVKLETWLIAGRRGTTEEALRHFLEKTAGANDARPSRRSVEFGANEAAKAELRKLGVGHQAQPRS